MIKGDGGFESVETWSLVIFLDGTKYRIVGESVSGTIKTKEEVGSDGLDTFVLADGRSSILNLDGNGLSGFVYAGRFPEECPLVIQAVWLGCCAQDHFDQPSQKTGLNLSSLLRWTPAANVTNQVVYWPDSKLAQTVTGWSRNWVTLPGRPAPEELKQYPNGFKVWRLTTSDIIHLEGAMVPRRIVLEGFAPKPPADATTGEDTTLTRRISINLLSVEEQPFGFDPFPAIPVSQLEIADKRFIETTKARTLVARAGTNGWPTRSSSDFGNLQKMVQLIALENAKDEIKPGRTKWVIITIVGINGIIGLLVVSYSIKKKQQNKEKVGQ